MAPTVCSEKKVRVAGLKESRRPGSMGVAQSSTNIAAMTAAGATQNSTVLSYVAKGSMNSARLHHRRRIARMSSRMQQNSKKMVSTSSEIEIKQGEEMEVDEDATETNKQLSRTHSSSSTNFKTVLQPTTVNSNSNSSNSYHVSNNDNNKTSTTAKLCDQSSSTDDDHDEDDEEEDQGDGDSGYEFALEPIRQTHSQQQYPTNNEGLLNIALKTIKLVQRNKMLQKRLAQLQLETSEFVASVLANPENRHIRDKATVNSDALAKVY